MAKSPQTHKHFLFFLLQNWQFIILGFLVGLYAITFSYFSILRHNAFASGFDLANADQTIWNTVHGNFFSLSSLGKLRSRFTIHADLIFVLLAPLFFIWENVRILLIAQSVVLALGAIPVYLLARKILKNGIAGLILSVVYLLNPMMQWANMYDFHGVTLSIPFLLFAFYCAVSKKWKWFAVYSILAAFCKEEVAMLVATIGLFIFFYLKERRIGIVTFLLGMAWSISMIFLVMPLSRGGDKHWAMSWFHLSDSAEEVEVSQEDAMRSIYDRLIYSSQVAPYYYALIKPFGVVFPLIGLPLFALAIPELVINTLSTHGEMRSTILHYTSGIIPFLVIATIYGISALLSVTGKMPWTRRYKKTVLFLSLFYLLSVSLVVSVRNSPLPYNKNCFCQIYSVTDDDIAFELLLAGIPQYATITASPEIKPHLTHRVNAYTLPRYADSADYIAIIDQNRMVGDYNPKGFELTLLEKLDSEKKYELVRHIGHFYLYKKIGFSP